jgi:dihydropteroate synthase
MTLPLLDCGGRPLDLSRPAVMGILNVTPDSFSDGGKFLARDKALRQAETMVRQGAAILDVGGESTRPGAEAVSVQQELDRVLPVVEQLAESTDVPISIDTSKPEVMAAAVQAGAGLINDVFALRRPGALQQVAALQVPVCLMHMQGEPGNMQQQPRYAHLIDEVNHFFTQRVTACEAAGIARQRLLLDPGFGFGKTLTHNLQLLASLHAFGALGLPLLVGISRKRMIGALLNDAPVDDRLSGSLAAAVLAVERGARIVRCHDVRQTVDALSVVHALMQTEGKQR